MNGLLEKLDDAICANLPPHKAQAYREARQLEERQRVQFRKTLISECAEAIECLSLAIRSPHSARTDLEAAAECVRKAMAAAEALDPEV